MVVVICFMSFYCMGKDHKDLKLPKWVMFSCSILEITTIACLTPCSAIPSHLIHIIVPSSMLSQTTLYEQRALYSIFNYIKPILMLLSSDGVGKNRLPMIAPGT